MSLNDMLPWYTVMAIGAVSFFIIVATHHVFERLLYHEHEPSDHYNGRCWCGSGNFQRSNNVERSK